MKCITRIFFALIISCLAFAQSHLPHGSEYIPSTNGMAFLVTPSPVERFRVWDCFTTSATFNAYEGLSLRELVDLSGGRLFTEYRGALIEKISSTDPKAQDLINRIRGSLARIHTFNEVVNARRVYNQIFKIAAIVKKQQSANAKGEVETLVESMLISKVVKDLDGTENTWLVLNSAGLDTKIPLFQVACPEKGKFGKDQDAAEKAEAAAAAAKSPNKPGDGKTPASPSGAPTTVVPPAIGPVKPAGALAPVPKDKNVSGKAASAAASKKVEEATPSPKSK